MKSVGRLIRFLYIIAGMKLRIGGRSEKSALSVSRYTDADYSADTAKKKYVSGALLAFG